MKKHMTLGHWAVALSVVILAGCTGGGDAGGGGSSKKENIVVDGSSSLGPVTEVAAESYREEPDGASVLVSKGGTGTGMTKMIEQNLDICDASRPIKADEMKKCADAGIKYFELPICYDALTVIINNENDWAEEMTVEELSKMWKGGENGTGETLTWDEINPNWPKEKFALFGADTSSGTFDYFGEAIAHKKHRSDYSPSSDDNQLLEGVVENKYALGYVPYTYYASSKDRVKAVKIIPPGKGPGEGVEPSPGTALSGAYTPLARPLFIYVPSYSADKPAVKKFVEYYITNAEKFANTVNYLPLSADNYQKVLQRFHDGKTGTVYGGEAKIGLTADDLLNLDLVE